MWQVDVQVHKTTKLFSPVTVPSSIAPPSAVCKNSSYSTSSPELDIVRVLHFLLLFYQLCYLIWVLICIFLVDTDVEQFFLCLFAIYSSSLIKFLFKNSVKQLPFN